MVSQPGHYRGTGSQVTFTAPSQSGSINIGLTVSDNRGSQTTGSVTVTVISPTITVTINPTPSESGTVNQYNATDYANFMAGDNAKNVGMRAFWSFDIGSLTDKDIRNATLKYTTGTIVGNPFAYAPPTGLGGLRLWQDNYGMTLPVYGYLGFELINTGLMYSAPTSVDVTTEVRLLTSHGVGRFQTEALFTRASNGDLSPNYIQWSSVVLEVTYAAE